MKPIIIDMNEMSESSEVYYSRPNRALPFFLYVCLGLFVAALVWMWFGRVDTVVNASGILNVVQREETEYNCVIWVGNADVGDIEPGMAVKLNVYSYPNTEYGYVYGTLTKVAKGIRVDAQSGLAYYQAEAKVLAEEFLDATGEPLALKTGMTCEAKILTGEKRILKYLLEKL